MLVRGCASPRPRTCEPDDGTGQCNAATTRHAATRAVDSRSAPSHPHLRLLHEAVEAKALLLRAPRSVFQSVAATTGFATILGAPTRPSRTCAPAYISTSWLIAVFSDRTGRRPRCMSSARHTRGECHTWIVCFEVSLVWVDSILTAEVLPSTNDTRRDSCCARVLHVECDGSICCAHVVTTIVKKEEEKSKIVAENTQQPQLSTQRASFGLLLFDAFIVVAWKHVVRGSTRTMSAEPVCTQTRHKD